MTIEQRIADGVYHDPHEYLGWHHLGEEDVVRALRPLATAVSVEAGGVSWPMTHHERGLWELRASAIPREHRIRASYSDSPDWVTDDPYRFTPTLGELDLHLIAEGRHEELWHALGARVMTHEGTPGVAFTVWAPRARAVRVCGEMNAWDGRRHAMRSLGTSGVWELFIPEARAGQTYKFEILGRDGHWRLKADPMARAAEEPPATASRITQSQYDWRDTEWMLQRAARNAHDAPMSVYEVHLGSWRPGLGYREAAPALIEYVRELGYTHVEFLPLAEHPFGGSWGYQVSGYYAPTARFGSPDDLRFLIDELHRAGIGVILDWVPGHFPKDEFALARFDGEPLYEHPDPRRGEQPDWGTLVFDYGNPHVRNFLVANALYWLEEFHVDGLRVDAVASMLYLDYSRADGEWVPNEHGGREHLEAIRFLQETNATAYRRSPGVVMIAEESTAWPGVTRPTDHDGLGFGLKWNMGWMHDSLQYMQRDPAYRSYHHNELTFSLAYAWSEQFILPISHDEVVHGKGSLLAKMPGDDWQQLANLRAYLAFMWAHPGKKLLFMGQEFGQRAEWSEHRSLDWWLLEHAPHAELQRFVARLNTLYRATPALWQRDTEPRGFEWLEGGASRDNVIAFARYDANHVPLVCVVNFAGHPHEDYRVAFPSGGEWNEVLNSDGVEFGGSGVGNLGTLTVTETPWAGRAHSAPLRLPPLGALWLRPSGR
ncbi:MAG TPA: 1,4-alpha-glucan branching protein GlgB [Microbacteriaceae bacterium]|nr:1,4-alpha-glucan branching protein GlgB [Microbacteriaceae bacterium]